MATRQEGTSNMPPNTTIHSSSATAADVGIVLLKNRTEKPFPSILWCSTASAVPEQAEQPNKLKQTTCLAAA